MEGKRTVIAVLLAGLGVGAWAGDFYFGGYGDTKSQWTGYSVEESPTGLTNWVAYTLAQPGKIAKAPATFQRTSTNTWSAMFDEHVFRTNGTAYGLAKHDLVVCDIQAGRSIEVHDGQVNVLLTKVAEGDLKRIQNGRPNVSARRYGSQARRPSALTLGE